MTSRRIIITVVAVVVAIVCLFLLVGKLASITGYAVASDATYIGNFSAEHPSYGAVKGNIMWAIYDAEGNVIGADPPTEELTVYFTPSGEEVNLSLDMSCVEVNGSLTSVDADNAESQCVAYTYSSPTSYNCTITEEIGIEEVTPNGNTLLLLHLNNDSDYGENNAHVYDFAGGENNGTPQGNAAPTSSGKLGGAFQFDGNGDYIEVADDNSLDITTALTIEAWVKPDTISHPTNHRSIVDHGNSYWFFINGQSSKLGFLRFKNGNFDGHYTDVAISTGVWTHVAVTYNSSAADELRMYINGVLNKTVSLDGPIDAVNSVLRIGDRGSLHYFNGTIDEVAVHNRVLSAAEIAAQLGTTTNTTVYKTNTSLVENNAGCFAAKIPGGEYDMYV